MFKKLLGFAAVASFAWGCGGSGNGDGGTGGAGSPGSGGTGGSSGSAGNPSTGGSSGSGGTAGSAAAGGLGGAGMAGAGGNAGAGMGGVGGAGMSGAAGIGGAGMGGAAGMAGAAGSAGMGGAAGSAGFGGVAGTVIGPAGGVVSIPGVTLTIPAGALTSDTGIQITETTDTPPATLTASTPIYRFEPEGLEFDVPATVEFDAGTTLGNAAVFWTEFLGSTFDDHGGTVAGQTITADIEHFSRGIVALLPNRHIAFQSSASNLVTGDTNGVSDIFVHSIFTGNTVRISVSSAGVQADAGSFEPTISDDGRYVAFFSDATNLVTDDTNGLRDVFVHDRDPDGNQTFDEGNGTTTRMSVGVAGAEATDVSLAPNLSGNGRWLAFSSRAPLLPGDSNSDSDAYVRDRDPDENGIFDEGNGVNVMVSNSTSGAQPNQGIARPKISNDGRFVVFESDSDNLVATDTNSTTDIFLHDRDPDTNGVFDEGNGTTVRVSLDGSGNQANNRSRFPAFSGNGRRVAFESMATNLVSGDTNNRQDIFVREISNGQMTLISQPAGPLMASVGVAQRVSLSDNGLCATFFDLDPLVGESNNLADVFAVRRGYSQEVVAASVNSGGGQAFGGPSNISDISGDCRYVTFTSSANNLVANDTNTQADIFLHDLRHLGETVRVSVSSTGAQANGASTNPVVSRR